MYIGTPSSPAIRAEMSAGRLACMTTPEQGNLVPPGAWWAADNGKFGKGWPGHQEWFAWLSAKIKVADPARCLFASAPDVVGDAVASLPEALPWLAPVRALGIPVAFVAQDGCAGPDLIPWGRFDVLFLGGTDEFKLGREGALVARLGVLRGVPVHMGRVNSRKRLKYAIEMHCATVDGTYLAFGPEKNLARLARWHGELGLENFMHA